MEYVSQIYSAGSHNSWYRCSCLVQVWFREIALIWFEARWPDVVEFKDMSQNVNEKKRQYPSKITLTGQGKLSLKIYIFDTKCKYQLWQD